MKFFILTLLFPLFAVADQGSILGTARDKKLIELMDKITTYCSESHPELLKEKDSLFLCYLQLQADAQYSEEPLKGFAVSILNGARYTEDHVLKLQGSAIQVSKTYIGSEVERIKDPCKFNPSLAECKLELFGQLATADGPTECSWVFTAHDPLKQEKICAPPIMYRRVPAGSK